MLATKSLLAVFAIAAGGFLNAGMSAPTPSLDVSEPVRSHAGPLQAADVPTDSLMQRAAERALLAQIRQDLGDQEARLRLSALHFTRASGRSMEGLGRGVLSFDSDAPVPVEVTVTYDLVDARVEQAAYLVSDTSRADSGPVLDPLLRQRIADRIGARLVIEFAQQPVDFALGRIDHLAGGSNRLLISGEGLTRFAGEGSAATRFVATADRRSGRILTIQYELGQQLGDESSITSIE